MASRIEYNNSPAQVMARAVDAVLEGVEAAASMYDRDFLPDHFQDGAAARYGYAKRSGEGEPARVYRDGGEGGMRVTRGGVVRRLVSNPKYYWQKQRRGFGTTPLVYSGRTKAMALAGGKVTSKLVGQTAEGTDRVPVPDYLFKRPKSSTVDKPAELTAVTVAQVATLSRAVENVAGRALNRPGASRPATVAAGAAGR